jgi:hypothetical protein
MDDLDGNPLEDPSVSLDYDGAEGLSMKRNSEDNGELEPMTAPERRALIAFSLLVIVGFALLAGRLAVPDLWP